LEQTFQTVYGNWSIDDSIAKKARLLIKKNSKHINNFGVIEIESFICFNCRDRKTGERYDPYWYSRHANICGDCYPRILSKHLDKR